MSWETAQTDAKAEYAQTLSDLERQIFSLLYYRKFADPVIKLTATSDGYELEYTQMYDYVEFEGDLSFLRGIQSIADILGCRDADEDYRHRSRGCETCDYGSSYSLKWRFWNKKEATECQP